MTDRPSLWGLRLAACLSMLGVSVLAWLLLSSLSMWEPARWGVAVAAGLMLPSYGSLSLTLARSDRVFYTAFVAGMIFRLVGFGVSMGIVIWTRCAAPAPFATALALGMLVLSFIELFFLEWQNRRWTSFKRSNTTSSTTSFSA